MGLRPPIEYVVGVTEEEEDIVVCVVFGLQVRTGPKRILATWSLLSTDNTMQ
jgi:hypothetical protein